MFSYFSDVYIHPDYTCIWKCIVAYNLPVTFSSAITNSINIFQRLHILSYKGKLNKEPEKLILNLDSFCCSRITL